MKIVALLLGHVRLFVTPWIAARQAPLSFTVSRSLLRLRSIESGMLSNYLILCSPLLLFPSIFPSIRVFSNELALHIRWLKYRSFSISPSNEYSGLITFTIDWFDLAVQGTLKSLLQHYILKTSIIWHSGFFMVQFFSILDYWKTIALTVQTFAGKVMSLLFDMLSRFVIAFLPRSKRLLISWLQSSSAVIWEPKKIKPVTASTFSLFSCHEMMELNVILVF